VGSSGNVDRPHHRPWCGRDRAGDLGCGFGGHHEDADAAAKAQIAEVGDRKDRSDAEEAWADLAQAACLGTVTDVLRDVYSADDLEDTLAEAGHELKAIVAECAPSS
jgi:hypothetical protein